MVVSKDSKRKRKDAPTTEASPEIPKRAKVQAQRKFAQGQGTSTSYAIPSVANTVAASSSQPGTPVKDGKEPTELITHKRPRTEDFLTFLCYRGTSVLPSHLDFLNQNKNNKTDEESAVTINELATSSTVLETLCESVKLDPKPCVNKKDDALVVDTSATKKETKAEIMPFAVRKRADQVAEGNRLRDRIKKEEINRRSPRTRGYGKVEVDSVYSLINEASESMCDGNEVEKDASGKIPEAKKEQKTQSKQKRKYTKQNNEECTEFNLIPDTIKGGSNDKESKIVDKLNEKSPSNNLANPVIGETKKTGRGRKKQNEAVAVENVGRMTRQRAFFEPVKVPKKEPESELENESKLKAGNELKKDSGNELKIKQVQIETQRKDEKFDGSKCEEKSEFSSDDEQPLAKSMKILTEKHKKKVGKKAHKTLEMIIPDEKLNPEKYPPNRGQSGPKPTRGRRPKKLVKLTGGTVNQLPEIPRQAASKEAKKSSVKRPKEIDQPSDPEGSISVSPPKAEKAEKKTENDQFSQQSHTDLSEHETKSGRPMRKTKEAAAIYMELIGQKLNLEEFEEDNESIDSFPELPNAKKTEKMENELKLKVGQPAKAKNNAGRKQMKKEPEETQPKRGKTENEHGEQSAFQKKMDDNCNANKAGDEIQKCTEAKDMSKNKVSLCEGGLLEKSFDDSDDEPLATKILKPVNDVKNEPVPGVMQMGSNSDIKETLAPPIIIEEKPPVPPVQLPIVEQPRPFSDHKPIQRISSPSKFQTNKQPNRIVNTVSKPSSPTHLPTSSLERFPSPKVNPTFLTPKFDRSIERRLPPDPIIPPPSQTRSILTPSSSIKAEITGSSTSPLNSTNNSKKYDGDSFLSANLMPSKEESGKIFGIASVSLAQSSGPDNTKCTLGKCGSIHKPVLGPVVPTEAYLGEQLSSKDRRKAKVNMTHEQIQKWLTECSSNPDEIQDDLDDDFDDNLKPMTFAPSPTLIREERDLAFGTSSKTSKETLKSEHVWSGRGLSLKSTAITTKDEVKPSEKALSYEKREVEDYEKKSLEQVSLDKMQNKSTKTEKGESRVESGKASHPKQISDVVKSPKPSTSSTATSSPKHQKSSRTSNTVQKIQIQKNLSEKSVTQKEQQNQQLKLSGTTRGPKRQPVYTAKLSESLKKKNLATNSFSAFSPENETSVYSFDKEDDVLPPLAKPFRRHSRRESNTEENSQGEKPTKNERTEKSEKREKTPCKEPHVNNSISLTLSPEENSKLIKVSLDGAEKIEEKKSCTTSQEKSAKNEHGALGDSDSECHTFYIPLQGTSAAGNVSGKSSDVIQGVAVKLGREGPDGPNQRVVMHATLVTKAQMGSNTAPLPESMNVHEIVKNLLSSSSKESIATPAATPSAPPSNAATSKSVPVGTVQPRFKSNSDAQNASGSGLIRVNSNSSLFSGSNKSRPTSAKKVKDVTPIKMCNNTAFPHRDDPSQMVEAPVFRPTEKEFADPMEFIERITPIAARFGICKIIPPDSFKPECRVSDDMRFTAYNQYIHKMLHRWGPNAKELSAIKKYLTTQSIAMAHPPWIGGMEIDLPRLYHTVQQLGGLKEVIEKKKWAKVAEEMCIPKLAQDRATKLDDIYCKYLLPYDTLSPAEREKLFDEVEADWLKKESRARRNADRCVNPESVSNEEDDASSEDDEESEEDNDAVSMECIVKGRSMPLNQFFRIARNTMAMWFKNSEPTVADIESEFWRLVSTRENHVCVNSGSIDSSGWGYGFPTPGPKTKGSPCVRHPWNLKVLTNNSSSILRSLGPVMGVTVPTLHVGMLFSCCCWYRDPHGLSWIEYLHTGANKIWYGIPDEQSSNFRSTLTSLIPTHCQNKTIWLPCDTAMVPPHVLTERGVSLCRTVQKPGEFVVMFPRAYTSSMATGYVVSESVYFATSSWLESAKEDFKDIHESCEPAMFSLEQLLFAIASDQRVSVEILSQILPMITEVYDKEVAARQQLKASGVTMTEKIPQPPTGKAKKYQTSEEFECDLCRANLYISMVKTEEGNIYCLQHALRNINNGNVQAKQCKIIFAYNIEDIENLLKKLKDRSAQQKKKSSCGSSKKSQK